jgi:HD superfamily phosphohydrolase
MNNQYKSNNQFILHDAVHGTIDLRYFSTEEENEIILKILSSPYLNRLRNIKQLGFASHSHPSADHSRYAHAIGTMHIMSKIFFALKENSSFEKIIDEIENIFECKFTDYSLRKHLLIAGLLQDIGELPYTQATQGIVKPNQDLEEFVYRLVGKSPSKLLNDKEVFTIGAIYSTELKDYLDTLKINLEFLTFLITGYVVCSDEKMPSESLALIHMTDGEVDADRLDYVFRDGHHSYGFTGNPSIVISSILTYDKDGPIFSDSGPVSEFFLKRGQLWTTVYLAPEYRFRNVLLKTFLKGYFKYNSTNELIKQQISLSEFKEFDDASLSYNLNIIFEKESKKLPEQCKLALDILLHSNKKYEWFWIPSSPAQMRIQNFDLPISIFYDTFSNYRVNLFTPKSIRIVAEKYKKLGTPLFLEDCSGAFGSLSDTGWTTLPKKDSILLFKPFNSENGFAWKNFTESFNQDTLFELIYQLENGKPDDIPNDTWNSNDSVGPKIFVSYAFSDRLEVDKIISCLYKLKRKYRVIKDLVQGIGTTTYENSIRGIDEADVIIMVASTNYLERYTSESNVRAEINRMLKIGKTPFPLPIDKYNKILDLPWIDLGLDKTVTAYDLRNLPTLEYEKFVTAVLKEIDNKHEKK